MIDLSRAHFSATKHLFCTVSLSCDKKCSYCYLPIEKRQDQYSIPVNLLNKYLIRFKELNVKYLTLVGGEPGLLNDFYQITTLITEMGFRLIVQTNGSLTIKQLKHLKKINTLFVSISIDSPNSENNDVGRYKGATRLATRFLENASELNLPIRISTVVSKSYFKDIEPLIHFSEKYNVNHINLHRLEVLDHQGSSIQNYSLDPTEWISQFKLWREFAKDTNIFLRAPISFLSRKYAIKAYENKIDCPPIHNDTYNLLPSGKVYRCPLLVNEEVHAWNLVEQNSLSKKPNDSYLFEDNNKDHGLCPILMERDRLNYTNLLPVCPLIKTTLNPNGGTKNRLWDDIVFDFLNSIEL